MKVLQLLLKKYPWVLMAPIFVGIILVGISMAYTIYQSSRYMPPTIPKNSIQKGGKGNSSKAHSLDHYAIIFQRDLFASTASGIGESLEGKTDTDSSTVPFKLRGTAVVKPGVSIAIIEDPATRKQKVYHQDEMVQGFKILQILRNKVIVDKNGREEVVEVVKEKEPPPVQPVKKSRVIRRRPVRRPSTTRTTPVRRPAPGREAPSKGEAPSEIR